MRPSCSQRSWCEVTEPVRILKPRDLKPEELLQREWLVANGLGGYASGTIPGIPTRRYHSLLVAALPSPLGRVTMLNHVTERVRFPDQSLVELGGEQLHPENSAFGGAPHLAEFRLELGLPVWRFEVGGAVVEKRILLPHMQNTVHLRYQLLEGPDVRLHVQIAMNFRSHESAVNELVGSDYLLSSRGAHHEISVEGLPPLRLIWHAERGDLRIGGGQTWEVFYRDEADRGYAARGALWSPGYFAAGLRKGESATLVASTENWATITALAPAEALAAEEARRRTLLELAVPEARSSDVAELVLAADQFLIFPAGRVEDTTRARAAGRDIRTVVAGYHWFTDWGRDTMIALEGLTLTTGRQLEASWILHAFAQYVRDGLIPNMFPEGEREAVYHTADASLWFFHAIERYTAVTGDRSVLHALLPTLEDIVAHHLHGTRFGIGVDSEDGMLRQGAEGYQLTWMDAKVEDWVVTPRRGKAVEINALWYNALKLLESWVREARSDSAASELANQATRARESFNRRFWYEQGGYLYDVVDGEHGDDTACRPNQLLAMSLDHPVLDRNRWQAVFNVVTERLLTPFGLRSLAPGHPDYKSKYFGDLRARDAAYHQGTVWAWLVGPFVDAWCRLHPDDRAGARRYLDSFLPHLNQACIGQISEIFDAESPFTPRGCIAQAWSVAEILRAFAVTER